MFWNKLETKLNSKHLFLSFWLFSGQQVVDSSKTYIKVGRPLKNKDHLYLKDKLGYLYLKDKLG